MLRAQIYDTMTEAVADIPNDVSLMLPGFGGAGSPLNLITALFHQGATGLTCISNGIGLATGRDDVRALGDFVEAGRVKKAIASFTASTRPSRPGIAEVKVRDGTMEAELTPQGTLAERIRAGGSGIPAFYTPTGVGTRIAEGKELRPFDGRDYLLETALFADYAFIRAWKADTAGNLIYRRAARNYNPIMSMAAACTIVEVEEPIVPAGELEPDHIHTPGIYVDRLVQIPEDGLFWVDRNTLQGPPARGR
jgi:3-oxoacid CoA-transferase A subunit